MLTGLFILVNAIFIYFEVFWLAALPLALLVVGMALFSMDKLILAIVFLTPISVSLEKLEFGLGVILPTEPLMAGVMLVFLTRLFFDGKFDMKVIKHPITIAIFFNLFWLLITAFTSELPLVSFKFLISRLWFLITCYFLATQLFRNPKNIYRYFWLYIIPLTGVIIYTIIRHATHAFEEKPAHWVMQPFFKDHTSYGALIAMYIPILFGLLFKKNLRVDIKIIGIFFLLIFTAGIILSYTRAAWVSLAAGIVVYLILVFRVRFSIVFAGALVALAMFFSFQDDIFQKLEKNRQDSSGDLSEHVESISNVASDASNLERINRWMCALRMFEERPIFGWGPGTYMFQYAPFQHSSEITIISTNFGNLGNSHSEYFGPLAETGILGLLTFLAIIAVFLYKGITLYSKPNLDKELKLLLLMVLVGLVTYLVHGVLNNFLDTDKASIPFWGFVAVIVAIDVYHKKGLEKPAEELEEPTGE